MIKKGYQIQIESWENDCDFYNTKCIDGLTKEQVKDYISFLNKIKRYEDMSQADYDSIREEMISENNSLYIKDLGEQYKNDQISDLIFKTLGFSSEGEYVRVLESIKVYYYPGEVSEVPLTAFKD